jgi:hypothetical protein
MSFKAGGRAVQSGRKNVTFTASKAATATVTFPIPYPAGSTPNVTVSYVGTDALFANATSISPTGFTIAAYHIPAAITNTLPFSWIAHGPGPA